MEKYQQLENALNSHYASYGAVCSSGIAALHLAIELCKIKESRQHTKHRNYIIVPDYCMYAVPRAVALAGCIPLFMTWDKNFNIDLDNLEVYFQDYSQSIREDVLGIVLVHNYGRTIDRFSFYLMKRQLEDRIGKRFYVIEDMAENHYEIVSEKTDYSCFSFYKNKVIAGEEGGYLCTKNIYNHSTINEAKYLRSLGMDSMQYQDYIHHPYGNNYRLSNCHAELILDSLYRFHDNKHKRFMFLREFRYHFNNTKPEHNYTFSSGNVATPWVFDFYYKDPLNEVKKAKIMNTLKQCGIQVRSGFFENSKQAEFRDRRLKIRSFPNNENTHLPFNIFYIPLMYTNEEIEKILSNETALKEIGCRWIYLAIKRMVSIIPLCEKSC